MEEFINWCKKSGMIFDGIEIRKASEDSGYGVFATRNFRPEEKLIVIPDEFMLSGGKVANMKAYSDIADTARPRLTPFEMLTIFFAMEDPDSSIWSPYLRILPQTFDTPDYLGIDFTPDDLPQSEKENFIKHQHEINGNISKIQFLLPNINKQKLMWAWHVVNTRCVYNENQLHPKLDNIDGGKFKFFQKIFSHSDTLIVAPLIDMLNHDNVSQCLFLADKRNRNYIVKANSTLIEGSEAKVTYGPHSNGRLWYSYGFRLTDNIHNKVAINNELLFELVRKVGLEITENHEEAVRSGNFPSTLYASDEGLSWQFITNIKILLLTKEEVSNYKSHIFNNDDDLELTNRIFTFSIRILELLAKSLQIQKTFAAAPVHWMWEENIELINTTIAHTRITLRENEEDLVNGLQIEQ